VAELFVQRLRVNQGLGVDLFMKNWLSDLWHRSLDKQIEKGQLEREQLLGTGRGIQKTPEEVVREYKKKQEIRRNVWVGIAVFFGFVWAYNYVTNPNGVTPTSVSSPAPIDTSWIPTEFDSYSDDPNVGWRWLRTNEFSCTGDSCWGMMIIAKDGCDRSLYAEISILDKNEVQIGYTNDSVSQALPMQKSKLIFNTYEDEANTARLSKISCY
jgi:hypothetical protein